jgi:hypothetical protein
VAERAAGFATTGATRKSNARVLNDRRAQAEAFIVLGGKILIRTPSTSNNTALNGCCNSGAASSIERVARVLTSLGHLNTIQGRVEGV